MGFFGKAQMPSETGWEHSPMSSDLWGRKAKQEAVQVVEEDEDEWKMLRNAAEGQDLKFSVHRGVIRVGRASFPETEQGVNQAWEYLDGSDAA